MFAISAREAIMAYSAYGGIPRHTTAQQLQMLASLPDTQQRHVSTLWRDRSAHFRQSERHEAAFMTMEDDPNNG